MNGRLPLYRSSGGPLSLEPRAPFSCRPGQSVVEPPGTPTRRVLRSTSSASAPSAASPSVRSSPGPH